MLACGNLNCRVKRIDSSSGLSIPAPTPLALCLAQSNRVRAASMHSPGSTRKSIIAGPSRMTLSFSNCSNLAPTAYMR